MANLIPLFDTPDGTSWRQSNPQFFASETALRWFWRQHRREVIERGAVVLLNGKYAAVEPHMTTVVMEIAQRAARRAIEEAA